MIVNSAKNGTISWCCWSIFLTTSCYLITLSANTFINCVRVSYGKSLPEYDRKMSNNVLCFFLQIHCGTSIWCADWNWWSYRVQVEQKSGVILKGKLDSLSQILVNIRISSEEEMCEMWQGQLNGEKETMTRTHPTAKVASLRIWNNQTIMRNKERCRYRDRNAKVIINIDLIFLLNM